MRTTAPASAHNSRKQKVNQLYIFLDLGKPADRVAGRCCRYESSLTVETGDQNDTHPRPERVPYARQQGLALTGID